MEYYSFVPSFIQLSGKELFHLSLSFSRSFITFSYHLFNFFLSSFNSSIRCSTCRYIVSFMISCYYSSFPYTFISCYFYFFRSPVRYFPLFLFSILVIAFVCYSPHHYPELLIIIYFVRCYVLFLRSYCIL